MTTVKIATYMYGQRETKPVATDGTWAVTRWFDGGKFVRRDLYVVTHIPTGLKASDGYRLRDARRAYDALRALPNQDRWRKIKEDACPKRMQSAAKRAIAAALMAAPMLLLMSAQAAAVPIIPPHHCGCTLAELPQGPHVNPPDPGYAPDLTLAQIAELRRLDDLHEPAPEPALWVWLCVDLPRPGGKPGEPERQHVPMGDGGEPRSVPEPQVWALLVFGGVGLWLRRRG